MSMQSEGQDAKGRNYDQVTKDGSTSAGSYGAGSTGDIGNMGAAPAGNVQRETRTDDLLSPAPDQEIGQGFAPGEQAGELDTGLGGIGNLATGNAGNRQSAQQGDSQSGDAAGDLVEHLDHDIGDTAGGQGTQK
jgi:hypothetical protein